MSYTEVYILTKDNDFKFIEVNNAFRGAMYVWNDVARRYCGYEGFPYSDTDKQMEVWNYESRHPNTMKPHEEIVLKSTMDGAIVESNKWTELVDAFKKYGEEHPNSNYSEQASEIEAVMNVLDINNVIGIAWNQTSVNGDPWCIICTEDDETEEYMYDVYDPNTHSTHFWVFNC